MAVKVDCPHCRVRLRIPDDRIGTQVRCPGCGRAFEAAAASVRRGGPTAAPVPRSKGELTSLFPDEGEGRPERRSPLSMSDVRVPTLLAGIYALGMTIGLAILIRTAMPNSVIARLFSHGAISFFTAFLSLWAATILVLKGRRIVFEKRSLRFDVLSQEDEEVIRPSNVHRFTRHIHDLPASFQSCILFRRISRALEYFRSTGSPAGVSAYLASQNDLDVAASESSYTMVKAFIWAVPILGFIGTVFGIGEAVNSFAVSVDAAEEVEAIRSSLGGVTSGLGTAFETTLVALIMSIFLMIPANWLQKTEDDLLTSIGSYCNEELLWRFEQSGGARPDGSQVSAVPQQPEQVREVMSQVVDQAKELTSTLEASVEALNKGLATSVEALGEDLPALVSEYCANVERSLEATPRLLEAHEALRERFAEAAEGESMESLLLKVNETHERMVDVLDRMSEVKPRRWWRLWR